MPNSTWQTRSALFGAALLFLASPVWADNPLGGLLLLFGMLFRVSVLLIGMTLPGAIIGANLAFAAGKRMRCIVGAILGNVPVIAAYAMFGGSWDDREWSGFFFTLFVTILPIVAIVVGIPVGYITYSIRSTIKRLKDENVGTPE